MGCGVWSQHSDVFQLKVGEPLQSLEGVCWELNEVAIDHDQHEAEVLKARRKLSEHVDTSLTRLPALAVNQEDAAELQLLEGC
jgi:hypothetical protein